SSDDDGMNKVEEQMAAVDRGLIFTNLVDFDTQHGHRNDVEGYARNLERFDARLALLLPRLRDDDLLVVTADHGNDPTTPSTDHAREYVPLLVTGARVRAGRDLGVRKTFADLGQTLADVFDVGRLANGTRFLTEITQGELVGRQAHQERVGRASRDEAARTARAAGARDPGAAGGEERRFARPAASRAGRRRPPGVPARSRSHHPLQGVSAAEAQDAGVLRAGRRS